MKYPRRDDPAERSYVARVVIKAAEREQEYRGCWIRVDRDSRQVLVWRDPNRETPDVAAPVEDVEIEWGGSRRSRRW